MIYSSQPTSLENMDLLNDVLFVFALQSEAAREFDFVRTCISGCGKINATYELLKAIQTVKPKLIVNLGSGGSHIFTKGDVVCCTQFLQRDMNATSLGFLPYETPFSDKPPILHYGIQLVGLPDGICGTGDNFETAHNSTDYNVVDMEAFALAHVAKQENIPFLCLKYISDGADGGAAEDWNVQVHLAAKAFKRILFPHS